VVRTLLVTGEDQEGLGQNEFIRSSCLRAACRRAELALKVKFRPDLGVFSNAPDLLPSGMA